MASVSVSHQPDEEYTIGLREPSLWYWWRYSDSVQKEVALLLCKLSLIYSDIQKDQLATNRQKVFFGTSASTMWTVECFSYLDAKSLSSVSQVCLHWREIEKQSSNDLWEGLCISTFGVTSKAFTGQVKESFKSPGILGVVVDTEYTEAQKEASACPKNLYIKLHLSSRLVLQANAAVTGLSGFTVNRNLMNFINV